MPPGPLPPPPVPPPPPTPPAPPPPPPLRPPPPPRPSPPLPLQPHRPPPLLPLPRVRPRSIAEGSQPMTPRARHRSVGTALVALACVCALLYVPSSRATFGFTIGKHQA